MFLVNSRLGLVSATLKATNRKKGLATNQVPLIPKLRGYFAEFLHHDSLERLGILYLSTCVGLGYGRLTTRSRRFSRQHRITHTTPQKDAVPSCLTQKQGGFTYPACHTLSPGQPPPGMGYLPASLRSLSTTSSGHRLTTPPTPESANNATHMLSITSLNTDVASPVPEYQLVVHRLRLSASP